MRFHGLVAVSVLALALPASCTPLSATPLPAAGDAEAPDGAGGDASSGSSGSSGGARDSGACAPGDVATYMPTYHPAAASAGCTDMQQISDFFDACFGPGKTTAKCHAFQNATLTGSCASCIVTPDWKPAYGPVIDHGAFVTANVGGCIELAVDSSIGQGPCADAGTAELECAKAAQALDGCEIAACEANCNVHDATSLAAYSSCAAEADAAECGTYAQGAQCTAPDAGSGACDVAAACLVADFRTFYFNAAKLFCLATAADAGIPPLDSGAPPLDAGAGD